MSTAQHAASSNTADAMHAVGIVPAAFVMSVDTASGGSEEAAAKGRLAADAAAAYAETAYAAHANSSDAQTTRMGARHAESDEDTSSQEVETAAAYADSAPPHSTRKRARKQQSGEADSNDDADASSAASGERARKLPHVESSSASSSSSCAASAALASQSAGEAAAAAEAATSMEAAGEAVAAVMAAEGSAVSTEEPVESESMSSTPPTGEQSRLLVTPAAAVANGAGSAIASLTPVTSSAAMAHSAAAAASASAAASTLPIPHQLLELHLQHVRQQVSEECAVALSELEAHRQRILREVHDGRTLCCMDLEANALMALRNAISAPLGDVVAFVDAWTGLSWLRFTPQEGAAAAAAARGLAAIPNLLRRMGACAASLLRVLPLRDISPSMLSTLISNGGFRPLAALAGRGPAAAQRVHDCWQLDGSFLDALVRDPDWHSQIQAGCLLLYRQPAMRGYVLTIDIEVARQHAASVTAAALHAARSELVATTLENAFARQVDSPPQEHQAPGRHRAFCAELVRMHAEESERALTAIGEATGLPAVLLPIVGSYLGLTDARTLRWQAAEARMQQAAVEAEANAAALKEG